MSIHGEWRAAHECDDHKGRDEDHVGYATPSSQRPRTEPVLLHDDAGKEDAGGRRHALAEAARGSDGRSLLAEMILEVFRDEGEIADDALFKF